MPSIYEGNKTKILRRHLSVHETKIIRGMLMDKDISATHENVRHIVICRGKKCLLFSFPNAVISNGFFCRASASATITVGPWLLNPMRLVCRVVVIPSVPKYKAPLNIAMQENIFHISVLPTVVVAPNHFGVAMFD
jgi:hypothetical protein